MKKICWELNSANDCAYFRRTKLVTPAKLRMQAADRMTAVTLVSAEFNGIPRVFETNFWVLMYHGDKIEFIGIYLPAFETHANDCLPTWCLRKGQWDKRHSHNILESNEQTAAGFKSGFNVIHTFFFDEQSHRAIVRQVKAISEYMANGITMTNAKQQKDKKWERIRIFIDNQFVKIDFEFLPNVKGCSRFKTTLKL